MSTTIPLVCWKCYYEIHDPIAIWVHGHPYHQQCAQIVVTQTSGTSNAKIGEQR
jgi:hypothetical protein